MKSQFTNDILVVDGGPESLKLLSDILIPEGYNVRSADNPYLALESALDNPPELILLDIKMPGMDGYDLCRKLKQDARTAEVPVILISVRQEVNDRIQGFESGAIDFIAKPISRKIVLNRVDYHITNYRMQKNLAGLAEEKAHQVHLDERRFSALYELSQMKDAPEKDVTAFALEAAVSMTGSEVGYLHFVDTDQEHIDLYQWSSHTMTKCTAEPSSHYPLSEAGIWADCVRANGPVIHNDYPSQSGKKGLPEGHFPLQRHMSVPIHHNEKIIAIIGVGNKQLPYDEHDTRQLSIFGGSMWSMLNERRVDQKLKDSLVQTIQAIALTLEQRDPYTAGHQRGVADLACAIAEEMGLDEEKIQGIRMGGTIHDIGKIYIPSEILNRPGKLSKVEFEIIKTHPEVGYQIVKDVEFPWSVVDLIYMHHERLDGSGYPQGLKGEEICLGARILAVADVVEAMATHRPYRPALDIGAALDEIERGSGVLYDPQAATACLALFNEKGFQLDMRANA
ncbi:MAG: HD domain-containing phosphohydrolase [Candidatus Sedimenticola sp. 20ELBAFRAG]